jgi:mycofactocin precursor
MYLQSPVVPMKGSVMDGICAPENSTATEEAPRAAQSPVEEISAELLIEEVSIDGMCGVY